MNDTSQASSGKLIRIILITFLLSGVVVAALRVIPIHSKPLYCSDAKYRIINGELDDYNNAQEPSAEMRAVMGMCAPGTSNSVRLYVL